MLNPVYKLKQVGLANNPNLLENCRDFLLKKGVTNVDLKNPHGEYQAFKFYGIHVKSKQILLASSSLNHILYSRSASQLFGTFY